MCDLTILLCPTRPAVAVALVDAAGEELTPCPSCLYSVKREREKKIKTQGKGMAQLKPPKKNALLLQNYGR